MMKNHQFEFDFISAIASTHPNNKIAEKK